MLGIPVAFFVVSFVMVIPFIPIRLATLDRVEDAAPELLFRPLADASRMEGHYNVVVVLTIVLSCMGMI